MRAWLLCLIAWSAAAAELPEVVFLEPVGKVNTGFAEIHEKMPLYRGVADASKYEPWLNNECAERALRLYAQAAAIVEPGSRWSPAAIMRLSKPRCFTKPATS